MNQSLTLYQNTKWSVNSGARESEFGLFYIRHDGEHSHTHVTLSTMIAHELGKDARGYYGLTMLRYYDNAKHPSQLMTLVDVDETHFLFRLSQGHRVTKATLDKSRYLQFTSLYLM